MKVSKYRYGTSPDVAEVTEYPPEKLSKKVKLIVTDVKLGCGPKNEDSCVIVLNRAGENSEVSEWQPPSLQDVSSAHLDTTQHNHTLRASRFLVRVGTKAECRGKISPLRPYVDGRDYRYPVDSNTFQYGVGKKFFPFPLPDEREGVVWQDQASRRVYVTVIDGGVNQETGRPVARTEELLHGWKYYSGEGMIVRKVPGNKYVTSICAKPVPRELAKFATPGSLAAQGSAPKCPGGFELLGAVYKDGKVVTVMASLDTPPEHDKYNTMHLTKFR